MDVSEHDMLHLLAEAQAIVDEARKVVLRHVSGGFDTRIKPDRSLVTDADMESEETMRREIAARFPEHGVIGEELPPTREGADFQWLMDPIDGTLSFAHGIPLYGIILALHYRGTPIVSVIDHPALDTRYSAARGLGAFRNGSPLHVKHDVPGEDIIAIADRAQFEKRGKLDHFEAVTRAYRYVRTYPDCFGHTLAVQGSVAAMIDYGIKIWDVAASQVLIEEAGGRFVCLGTAPGDPTRYNVILGRPDVVDGLLPLLA